MRDSIADFNICENFLPLILRRLHCFLGDRLRVQPQSGDEGPALTVTKMFVEGKPARKALPGQRYILL